MRRISIVGEIGAGNLGDDLGYLLLRDTILALTEDVEVGCMSLSEAMQEEWSGGHRALLLGAGTLLDTGGAQGVRAALRAAERGVPVAIIGTGVTPPGQGGFTHEGIEALDRLLNVAWPVLPRGPASAAAMGLSPGTRHGDPVTLASRWSVTDPPPVTRAVHLVPGYAWQTFQGGHLPLGHQWIDLARRLVQAGREVVWRPAWLREFDAVAGLAYAAGVGIVRWEPTWKEWYRATMAASVVVAGRLHAAILALCAGVPVTVAAPSGKFLDLVPFRGARIYATDRPDLAALLFNAVGRLDQAPEQAATAGEVARQVTAVTSSIESWLSRLGLLREVGVVIPGVGP